MDHYMSLENKKSLLFYSVTILIAIYSWTSLASTVPPEVHPLFLLEENVFALFIAYQHQ